MRKRLVGVLAFVLLLACTRAQAHRIDEVLQATLLTVEVDRVQGSLRIAPSEMMASKVIALIDRDADDVFSAGEEAAYVRHALDELSISIDGQAVRPRIVSSHLPEPARMHEGLGELRIDYTIDVPGASGNRTVVLSNRHLAAHSVYLANAVAPRDTAVQIVAQQRSADQSVYALTYRTPLGDGRWQIESGSNTTSTKDWSRWLGLFQLGMRHIAEGTDHLLFLIVLLLPAPLIVAGTRWGRPDASKRAAAKVLGIVTAFTVGHSITLGLSAIDGFHLAGRATEVLIAVSILVSATHASRPLFPGKEPLIAAAFGLVHGMAFGQALVGLGIDHWERVGGTLAFNLGIEAMQLLVVAAVLPPLLLIAKTAVYHKLRIVGALLACALSVYWIFERLFVGPSPDQAMDITSAGHLSWFVGSLFVIGFALYFSAAGRGGRQPNLGHENGLGTAEKPDRVHDRLPM